MNLDLQRRNDMRYVVEVDELSPDMLMNLKKNSRIIHIFSLINNMIAIETEDGERIEKLKDVSRVHESGICETHTHRGTEGDWYLHSKPS